MDNTKSHQNDNVENLDDINELQIIEVGVTKTFKIGKLRYNNVYLMLNMNDTFQDKPLEIFLDDEIRMMKKLRNFRY